MADKEQTIIETARVKKLACIECRHVMDVSHLPSFSEIKCPACGVQQTVPAKFGAFLLLSRLGSGGMGVIYHAVDRELGRHVAIKVMKRSLGDNQEFVRSFKHEAQAAAALNHRNVVQIYSFGQVAGQPYIVMELVDGGRLDDMIADGKSLDEVRALTIHIEVTEGLDAASQVGLVHGDIKPANILFGQNDEAKVVDFGLASFIGQQQQQQGQVWGTPYYIAPEKARGKKVDFRSDIYSLGATLFHVLAGQPPFDGPTPIDVVMARLHHPAPGLHEFNAELHPETAAMVARMLEKDPIMRYPSYEALLVDMQEALDVSRWPLKKASAKKTVHISAGIAKRSGIKYHGFLKKALIVTGALALILVVAGGGLRLYQQRVRAVVAAAEQKNLQAILDRGRETWPRINALSQTIMDNTVPLLPLAEKTEQLGQIVPEDEAAMIKLQDAVERVMMIANDVEEHRALAYGAFQSLATVTNSLMARQQADILDSIFNTLIANYNILEEAGTEATNALAQAVAMQIRIREANVRVRKAKRAAQFKIRADEAARQRALKQAREAERIRPIILQRELDMVDKARAANAPFIAQRQFDEAARAMAGLQPDVTLEESKTCYRAVMDSYRLMSKLKSFLIKSIRSESYPNGWVSGSATRDIVAANVDQGITIAMGSVGKIVMAWDQVSIHQMLKIARHYMDNSNLTRRERAEILLGIALFSYESGVFKTAEGGAAAACRQDASIKDDIRRLMPGLFVEP